jgi:hypothetical protein
VSHETCVREFLEACLQTGQSWFIAAARVVDLEHYGKPVFGAFCIEPLVQRVIKHKSIDMLAESTAAVVFYKTIDTSFGIRITWIGAHKGDQPIRIQVACGHGLFGEEVAPAPFGAFERQQHRQFDALPIHPVYKLMGAERHSAWVFLPEDAS